jgi:hypothetical protein
MKRNRWTTCRLELCAVAVLVAAAAAGCGNDEVELIPDPPGMVSCPPDGDRPQGPPSHERLADTGLYSDMASGTLAPGVLAYRPEFELWSDGASKQRWVLLPDGATIDTSNMDAWSFPAGAKLFKEFTRDGVRSETRMLEKQDDGRWFAMAYRWNEAQDDAVAVPGGGANALGTAHDIPSCGSCNNCHRGVGTPLGFSAIQLDHDLGGDVNLASLAADGRLSHAPSGSYDVPGDPTAAAALGYLHANCGNCHNDGSKKLPLRTWLTVEALGTVEDTPTFQTAVNQMSMVDEPLTGTSANLLVAPGDRDASLLYIRMTLRGTPGVWPPTGMPFVGSEDVDQAGVDVVGAWIDALQ